MYVNPTSDPLTDKLIVFVQSIGLSVRLDEIKESTFLPGICIENGGLVIDPAKLEHPGDILHEAGHLAVMPPDVRQTMNGDVGGGTSEDLGFEMMAMAWSYAACMHTGTNPLEVFHPYGYDGGGAAIADNFNKGRYFAVCTLQWIGLCTEPKEGQDNSNAYPKMIKWLRESDQSLIGNDEL